MSSTALPLHAAPAHDAPTARKITTLSDRDTGTTLAKRRACSFELLFWEDRVENY
jgi:hypothetical protein